MNNNIGTVVLAELAQAHTKARSKAEIKLMEMKTLIDRITKKHSSSLRKLLENVVETKAALDAQLAQSEAQFIEPKSIELHGVRMGFKSSSATVDFDNVDATVKLILAKFGKEAFVLLNATPSKTALKDWSDKDLKAIKAKRVKGTNKPFVTVLEDKLSTFAALIQSI